MSIILFTIDVFHFFTALHVMIQENVVFSDLLKYSVVSLTV